MEKIFKTHDAAKRAATRLFLNTPRAVAVLDIEQRTELIDDFGHLAGYYPFVAVVLSGEISEDSPWGDAWETFYYDE